MEENRSELIDIKSLLKSYLSKWYWFAISCFCCLIIGFLFTKTMRPQYEVKANIILSENDANQKSFFKDIRKQCLFLFF
ncbi:MAG: hypothetical protein K2M09_03355, partial [Muribaculaceae bacterium]|nr:hypothetical protein [Muribaculaceae bacterium]